MKRIMTGLGLFSAFAALTLVGLAQVRGRAGRSAAAAAVRLPAEVKTASESITAGDLLRHIKTLSADEYEGRAPGTRGEELTVSYITNEFKRLGLKAGNSRDNTYVQKVPLAGLTPEASASFNAGGRSFDLKHKDDYVALSRRFVPEVRVENSEVVFVGYGIVAPEYGWDDYKGVDVRGKTILMLINDPPITEARDRAKLDEKMFKGPAMTYYGRWTYKYEIAAEKGAAAAVIIHETGPAGYGWQVVAANAGRENFDIRTPDRNMGRAGVESWIHLDRAKELLAATGHDFEALKREAASKEFKPVALGARANFTVRNKLREVDSANVVAKIEGSDPRLRDEYLIYSAHWDHLGRDESLKGDQIYNGAIDNASGVAWMLEIAKAYTRLRRAPKRTIIFLAPTAEEKGLLGARYYGTNPLYPLEKTLADINMDIMNQWGRTRAIVSVGYGTSTLDELLAARAATQGRTVKPDPEPEKGYFYRSDHFELARQGVPALTFLFPGTDYRDKPADYGRQKREEYVSRDYHKVSDEIKPDWDLSGAVEDTQLLFEVGYLLAQGNTWPQWKPGTEFKAKREAMLRSKRAGARR
ncbi:MAG TPA: M28 family metallopeptidase [Pyrinomonadaceae bacterium]|jgi:Zn-dependent M28 family amino/carboxypeptidase|nr:M28 family metallopeptidase [Pyrinomonadaceae bacterium]